MVHDELRPARVGHHRGHAGSEGFEHHIAKRVGARGEDEDIHIGVLPGEVFAALNPGQVRRGEVLLKPFTLAAFAHDKESEGRNARGLESDFQFTKKAHAFFRGDPSDVTEPENAVVQGPARRREQLGIDAPLHQVDGPAGAFAQHLDEFVVGGVQDIPHAVERDQDIEDLRFGSFDEALACLLAHPPEHFRKAHGAELMQIGVPRNGQRQVQFARDIHADLAHIARAHHMNDIGLEVFDHFAKIPGQTPEGGVVTQAMVQFESERAASQFDVGQ